MSAILPHRRVTRCLHSELCGAPRALRWGKLAPIASLAGFVLLLSACSQRGAYDAVQQNRLNACNNEPTPELRADCRARHTATFDEYQQARAEAQAEETPDAQ